MSNVLLPCELLRIWSMQTPFLIEHNCKEQSCDYILLKVQKFGRGNIGWIFRTTYLKENKLNEKMSWIIWSIFFKPQIIYTLKCLTWLHICCFFASCIWHLPVEKGTDRRTVQKDRRWHQKGCLLTSLGFIKMLSTGKVNRRDNI